MKTSHISALGVAALVANVLSVTTGDIRADQPRSTGQEAEWEYKVEHCGHHSGLVAQLNQIGSERWELVQIADGMGVFKRLKTAHDKTTPSGVQMELLDNLEVIVLRGKRDDVKKVAGSMSRIDERRLGSTLTVKDEAQGGTGQQTSKEKADSTPKVTKYERMGKNELQMELRRLQKELLDSERIAERAKKKATAAAKAYKSASDEEKADALLRMIEADAASRKPIESYTQGRRAFDGARRAYFQLLLSEDLASTRVNPNSDTIERGMQLDANDREIDGPPAEDDPEKTESSADRLMSAKTVDELVKAFSSAEYSWQQLDVAHELVALGDAKTIPKIEKYLDVEDRRRRCNAALVIAGLGDTRGLAIIIAELEDKKSRPTEMTRSDGKPYPEGQISEDR